MQALGNSVFDSPMSLHVALIVNVDIGSLLITFRCVRCRMGDTANFYPLAEDDK